jgi:uncharacterized protein DUF3857/transglutaminase superfamily protein
VKQAAFFAAGILVFSAARARGDDWRPVTQSELTQKTPKVDPAADAEAIFWDVRIEDRFQGGDLSIDLHHYLRIKIFTDKGKEDFATVEIPRFGKRNISDVAARTIKQNGTIIDVKKDAIFDRDLVKTKGLKVKGKSFALPNVEVGDIIEYKYRETRDNEIASYMRLYFQRDIPQWSVTYHLKPLTLEYLPFGMRSMAFQVNHPPFQKDSQGFFSTTVNNVPAFKEEPNMPPEDQLRAWMLIYYEEDKKLDAEKFWKETGKSDFNRMKPLIKADDQVKRKAAELVSDAAKPEDKLAALDTFCRTKIRNTSFQRSHMTSEERKAVKENKSAGDTLKQKAGTAMDVDYLFAALANASGFDARIARVPNRGDTFFARQRPTTYFIDNLIVAVNVNDKWTFYDPASPFLETGMLPWQHELQEALVSDPKEGFFVRTQYSEPARSRRQRRGVFQLTEDGTLEGTLTYTYTGHVARQQKNYYEEMTAAQQEEDWKKSLQSRLNTAELSDFKIQNADDPAKPMVVTHKVSVPGYATRTGKRLLLQPAFFEHNQAPRFAESTRKWDVYFDYGWSEEDDVTITLPEGWQLDQPDAPKSSKFGPVGSYIIEVQKTTDGRQLIYRRHFEWGSGGNVLIPVANYAQIKTIFDFMQEQDNYTISLKQAATNAN